MLTPSRTPGRPSPPLGRVIPRGALLGQEVWTPPMTRIVSALVVCTDATGILDALAQRHRAILRHGCPLLSQKSPKASLATWNLRRLGQGNRRENAWLKLKKMTSANLGLSRGSEGAPFSFRVVKML